MKNSITPQSKENARTEKLDHQKATSILQIAECKLTNSHLLQEFDLTFNFYRNLVRKTLGSVISRALDGEG